MSLCSNNTLVCVKDSVVSFNNKHLQQDKSVKLYSPHTHTHTHTHGWCEAVVIFTKVTLMRLFMISSPCDVTPLPLNEYVTCDLSCHLKSLMTQCAKGRLIVFKGETSSLCLILLLLIIIWSPSVSVRFEMFTSEERGRSRWVHMFWFCVV